MIEKKQENPYNRFVQLERIHSEGGNPWGTRGFFH